MTRKANPDSKTQDLIYRPKTEEEKIKVKAAKEICVRNNIEMRSILAAGVDKFLREHNWPPGNSQTVLPAYGVTEKAECIGCHKLFPKSQLKRVEFISGLTGPVCPECLADAKEKTTWKRIIGPI